MTVDASSPASSLRVMICTANIGNEAPTPGGIAALLPEDGEISNDIRYPLPPSYLQKYGDDIRNHRGEAFDVIVIGMQESTFKTKLTAMNEMEDVKEVSLDNEEDLDDYLRSLTLEENGETTTFETNLDNSVGSVTSLQSLPARKMTNRQRLMTKRRTMDMRDLADGTQKRRSTMDLNSAGHVVNRSTCPSASGASPAVSSPVGSRPSSPTDDLDGEETLIVKGGDFGRPQRRGSVFNGIGKPFKKIKKTVRSVSATEDAARHGADAFGKDTRYLRSLIKDRCPNYHFLVDFLRGEMRLIILMREDLVEDVSELEVKATNTGVAGLANKGGIVASFAIYKTRLSFISAHLEAHEGRSKYRTRCNNLSAILSGAKVKLSEGQRRYDASTASHHCFICGDLNFRLVFPEEVVTSDVIDLANDEKWDLLNAADELEFALQRGHCLTGFKTPPCYFPPTFKIARCKGVRYNDQRTPSYTDRLLWRSANGLSKRVKFLAYEPCLDFETSDHKPIRSALTISTNASRFSWEAPSYLPPAGLSLSFQLTISDIKCFNLRAMDRNGYSDPYVMFITEPASLIEPKPSLTTDVENAKEEGFEKRTKCGWPRTRKIRKNLNPDWGKQQITLPLKGDTEDLIGAMLFLTVMDFDDYTKDTQIGTCVINLEKLFNPILSALRRQQFKMNPGDKKVIQESSVEKGVLKNGMVGGILMCDIFAHATCERL